MNAGKCLMLIGDVFWLCILLICVGYYITYHISRQYLTGKNMGSLEMEIIFLCLSSRLCNWISLHALSALGRVGYLLEVIAVCSNQPSKIAVPHRAQKLNTGLFMCI